MSSQLEEVAREKHITEVKLLKQSQQINTLMEENQMLKRHIKMQQTNLNHYRMSQALQTVQGAADSDFQSLSSPKAGSTLDRLRQERLKTCEDSQSARKQQHYIGDYTFSKDLL